MSGSYGVTLKDPIHPGDFNAVCIPYNVTELEQDFKTGLLETCPSSSSICFVYYWKKRCLQFLKNLQLNSLSLFHLMRSKQKLSTRKLSINCSLNFGLIKGLEEL